MQKLVRADRITINEDEIKHGLLNSILNLIFPIFFRRLYPAFCRAHRPLSLLCKGRPKQPHQLGGRLERLHPPPLSLPEAVLHRALQPATSSKTLVAAHCTHYPGALFLFRYLFKNIRLNENSYRPAGQPNTSICVYIFGA